MKKILIAVFLFYIFGIKAQVSTKEWAVDFSQISNMTVCDMMQTCNGQFIVLAGFRDIKGKKGENNTEGVVIVADAKTGAFVKQKSFKFRDQSRNSFCHVVETLNKTWLLVGKSGNNSQSNIGWIVRVKPTLELIEEKQFGVGGDNFFEKTAQKSDGTFGFIGQRGDKEGLLLVEYKTKWNEIVTKTDRLGDILALLSNSENADERWQVVGSSRNYGVWWSRLTEDGLSIKQAKSVYKPDIKASDISTEQGTYFFGTSWEKGAANIWVARLDTTTNINKNNKWTENLYNKKGESAECLAVENAQNGQYYAAISTAKGNSDKPRNKIVVFDGEKFNFDTPLSTDLDSNDNFTINGLTLGFDKTLWVWGETNEKIVRVVKLHISENSQFATKSKSINDLENLFAVKSELSDESQTANNTLEPNETATVLLNLTNISGQNISEITVQAQLPKWTGLEIESDQNNQRLKANKATLGFNITGKPNLAAGIATLVFTVRVNGQVRQELSVPIRCGASNSVRAKHEVWYNDASFNQGDRSKNSPTPRIEINGEVKSNKPLPSPNAQPKVVVKKSNRAKDELPVKKGTPYNTPNGTETYPFKINFDLEIGTNVIVVETDFGDTMTTDTLRIVYNPKPKTTEPQRLHVIAIAPEYRANGLDYNDEDIEDFVVRMKKQEGGLYSKVLIQKYLTYDLTTNSVIKKVFRDLARRCAVDYDEPDAIGKRDVIVVFFSSHGKIIRNQFKIVPSNFDDKDEEEEIETSVDYKKDILEKLERIVADTNNEAARKVLVLIDACHSGGAKSRAGDDNIELSKRLNALNSAAPGIITLSSTTEGLKSYEDEKWKNGAFTEAFLEALDNKTVVLFDKTSLKADTEEAGFGYLSLNEIYYFLQKRIPDLFLQHQYLKGFKQMPFMPTKKLDSSIPMFKL